MGVASLILGILSLIFAFIPVVNFIGIFTSLIGIVLGALGRKNPEGKGTATAGLVCSIIALVLCGFIYIACAGVLGAAGAAAAASAS